MITPGTILLVEDNEDDVFLMQRALKAAGIRNPLQLASDGAMALDYLSGAGKFSDRSLFPLPEIIFLDLKLPVKNGFEVLSWIRNQAELEGLPVVILSSSEEPKDSKRAADLRADSYLVKPPLSPQLLKLAEELNLQWKRN